MEIITFLAGVAIAMVFYKFANRWQRIQHILKQEEKDAIVDCIDNELVVLKESDKKQDEDKMELLIYIKENLEFY